MNIYYDPLDANCKSIRGGVRQNDLLTIQVYGKNDEPCIFVLQEDGCEAQSLHMQKQAQGWRIELAFDKTGLYFYHFEIGSRTAGMGEDRQLRFFNGPSVPQYQILVYSENFSTPDWFKGGIMYQIFPDRFYKSGDVVLEKGKWLHSNWNDSPEYRMNAEGKVLNNDFFGGNLRGIIDKLDYLQSLHVTILYLNPIFRAYSNHRYDTGDYMQLDPMLGTEEDFSLLIEECKARGISVLLDGVFNHTGDDSRYFNKYGKYDEIGAYQSKDSKYYAWYNFKHFPDKYDSWWGIDVLPAVNEQCPSYIDFITGEQGVLRYWMSFGLGGFRLDVADELPDEFIEKIRGAVKAKNSDAVLIGEVWEDASNKIAYSQRRKYFQGKELDSVMNYPLKDAILNFVESRKTALFRQTIAMLMDNYPKSVLDCLMNILGTHDTVRVLTALSGVRAYNKDEMNLLHLSADQRAAAKEKVKAAAVLLFTVFGVPCIYYGDEIGMEGYSDPFCRKPFSWDNIDHELLAFYRRLSEMRAKLPVFQDGEYNEVFHDEQCIVYKRTKGIDLVLVCMNLGNYKYSLNFDGTLYDLLSQTEYHNELEIKPNAYYILSNLKI